MTSVRDAGWKPTLPGQRSSCEQYPAQHQQHASQRDEDFDLFNSANKSEVDAAAEAGYAGKEGIAGKIDEAALSGLSADESYSDQGQSVDEVHLAGGVEGLADDRHELAAGRMTARRGDDQRCQHVERAGDEPEAMHDLSLFSCHALYQYRRRKPKHCF